ARTLVLDPARELDLPAGLGRQLAHRGDAEGLVGGDGNRLSHGRQIVAQSHRSPHRIRLDAKIWSVKVTVEMDGDLLARACAVARRKGTTVRALSEEGLRAALGHGERMAAGHPSRWPDLSAGGEGLSPDIAEGSWEQVRDRIYLGRGA